MAKRIAEPLSTKAPRKSRRRELSEEEHRLWQHVTREAKPLSRQRKPQPSTPAIAAAQTPAPSPPAPLALTTDIRAQPVPHGQRERPRQQATQPPPLTGLDRRTTQKLTRGQIDFEAKLDLHGHNQIEAQEALRSFLTRTRAAGMRCVLVVTGKGESPYSRHTLHGAQAWHAPERPGILRSALPRWLVEPEFRTLVVGFQPAHPRHGGGGACYIWLRRKR